MGSGTWTVTQFVGTRIWTVTSSGLTFDKGTGLIDVTGSRPGEYYFDSSGVVYNAIKVSATDVYGLSLRYSTTFGSVEVAPGATMMLFPGTTVTADSWNLTGTVGSGITIKSRTTSSATIAKSGGGTVTITGATISYLIGSPASTFYAPGCIDGGNNTNISFIVTTTRSVGLDALIAATATRSVGLDALIATTNTRSVGLDALIISTPSAGHTVKYLPRTVGVAAPARVREVAA
jgi:hypothetical protein